MRFIPGLLRRSPGYAASVILTLALGIGPVILVWSAFDAMVRRPLPFPEPEELYRLERLRPDGDLERLSVPLFRDLYRHNRVFAYLTAYAVIDLSLTTSGDTVPSGGLRGGDTDAQVVTRVGSAMVSDRFFEVLGVRAQAGRFFVPGEDRPGAPRGVVLSHGLWQRSFSGDLEVVGREIRLDHQPHRIVGVLPAGFELPIGVELWLPFNERFHGASRGNHFIDVIGRLADGVTVDEARERINSAAQKIRQKYSEPEYRIVLESVKKRTSDLVRRPLQALAGVVFLVFFVACANVANLAMARTVTRDREMALRAACGADPGRILRQLLTEMAWLTVGGGMLGLLFVLLANPWLNSLVPSGVPAYLETRVDHRILLFSLGLFALAHLLFSWLPARLGRGSALTIRLQDGGRSTPVAAQSRWRRHFVQTQMALTFVLLALAGQSIRDAVRVHNLDLGFDPTDVLTLRLALPVARYPEPESVALFYRDLLARLKKVPGVEDVAAASRSPVDLSTSSTVFALREGQYQNTLYLVVTPGYFTTLDLPVVAGRPLDQRDRRDATPAAVVNTVWARLHAGDGEVVGQRVWLSLLGGWGRIVGRADDARHAGPWNPAEPYIYLSQDQFPWWDLCLVLEHDGRLDLPAAIRRELATLDPTLPVFDIHSLEERIHSTLLIHHLTLGLLLVISIVAMVLAAVGLTGVVARTVEQERHSTAVRLALGAPPSQLRRGLVRRTLWEVLQALVAGLVTTLVLTPWLRGLLLDDAIDPATLAVAFALLALALALTSVAASHRLTEIDPSVVLRRE